MNYKDLPKEIENKLGIPVYLVGGSLRDEMLGRTPKDWDFCTPWDPESVELAIKKAGKHAYSVGKRFGTVGCKLEIDGKQELVEITTFRAERYDGKSRKPLVEFVGNLATDLSRRDFTINAMAMGKSGRVIDPWGGREDLENVTIKCVGKPKDRFSEDPLRILRGIRFSCSLGSVFDIDDATFKYMEKMGLELLRVSKERWVAEMDKILGSGLPWAGLHFMQMSGVMGVVVPELSLQFEYNQRSPYHTLTLWEHTMKTVNGVPKENIDLRWAALLHDIAKPICAKENKKGYLNYMGHEVLGADMALRVAEHLKFSNERRDYIVDVVRHHLEERSPLKEYDDAAK
jgi:putative nucleotidyltransferase with HDIG domain